MSDCTCGVKFRDAEDFRDHLPCEGTKEEQLIASLTKEVMRLKGGIKLIEVEAQCHEDVRIETMAKNILNGKDPYHYDGD
jgi:hypothetical protein